MNKKLTAEGINDSYSQAIQSVEASNMSITHRRLVRTEGQCPPNLSGPTSEATGT